MIDAVHEGVTKGAAGAMIAVAASANGTLVWPEAVQVPIVAESFEEGATMAGVARRRGLSRTQFSG